MDRLPKVALCVLVSATFARLSYAATWTEVSDAGALITTAQTTAGTGPLNEIRGVIENSHDVDLFKIFISNPSNFSAATSAGDPPITVNDELDAALALFDATGLGVYFNDDEPSFSANALLPAGDANSPGVAGIYYLAMFDDDGVPLSGSATTLDDLIFPLVGPPFTDVVGPTGGGGGAALSGWGFATATPIDFANGLGPLDGEYSIALSGAQFVVPLPAAFWLLASGLVGLAGVRLRKRRQPL